MSGIAQLYDTTIEPSKASVASDWITGQPWYRGSATTLQVIGSFRFVDPDGNIGIETLMLREDGEAPQGPTYQVPLTYRGQPTNTAGELVGTVQHGVLGTRYVYDGAQDPAYLAELIRVVLTGDTQSELSTGQKPDVTVRGSGSESARVVTVSSVRAGGDTDGDEILCRCEVDGVHRNLLLRLSRLLGETVLVGSPGGELAQTLDARWLEEGNLERTATLAAVRSA